MVLAYARGEAHVRLFGQFAAADLTVVLEHDPGGNTARARCGNWVSYRTSPWR